mgnify:CR=1 FL=1
MKTWVKYGAAIMGLLIVSALIISFGMKKEESYRDIKIMSIKGTATVERASVGSLDAYEEMKLESGDRLSVDSSSSLILSMDDNKYAMLEPGSSLTLDRSDADRRTGSSPRPCTESCSGRTTRWH